MHVLITGGTGFIGKALLPVLKSAGHTLTVLSRQPHNKNRWASYVTSLDQIESPVDAVINLAGASLAAKRWTSAYKEEIVSSRVSFTHHLVRWISQQAKKPKILISASAIGYYGTHPSKTFVESSPPGGGFASELCQQWESAALGAEAHGVRVVLLRLGVVLGRNGGALGELLKSFQFGVGSWLGSGQQILSWVHLSDVVNAIEYTLAHDKLSGAFNLTAPNPVTHRQFCEIAAERKRVFIKTGVPGFVMRLALGEMADELLLNGQKVVPEKLEKSGFEFRFESLDSALVDLVSRSGARS